MSELKYFRVVYAPAKPRPTCEPFRVVFTTPNGGLSLSDMRENNRHNLPRGSSALLDALAEERVQPQDLSEWE